VKKYITIALVTLMMIAILNSCKKDSPHKDYTASIKDKTWWGTLTYTGQAPEYYSIHFNGDNSFTWSQLLGDYNGHWVVSGRQLVMTIDLNGVEIKADISDDDNLMNITANTSYYIVNSGDRVDNPDILLDNTIWKGTATGAPTILRFKPGLKVEAELGNNIYGSDPYKRSASGAAIKSELNPGYTLFIVVISANEMRGADNSGFQWKMIKQ
jgi:hypothetical protein